MSVLFIAVIALAAGTAAFLIVRALRGESRRHDADGPAPSEALLLEEAVITEPVAPGLEGRAEIRKQGAALALRVRATDSGQAFARGAKVRVIDFREGCCFIESADEEHLVR